MSSVHMAAPFPSYIPTSDAMNRHEYGITKPRKQASTGGGRAWSEEEELYLLQTRLQKMPYKHIAAHLKKTELACRLHYHQLSHGSNRRKRNASISSGSSFNQSPVMAVASAQSPTPEMGSRSMSPSGGYGGAPNSPLRSMQLPSLMGHQGYHRQMTLPPRLPAILPKPSSLPHSESPLSHYTTPSYESRPSFPSLPRIQTASAALQLDCSVRSTGSALAPSFHDPSRSQNPTQGLSHQHIDMPRLASIYNAHSGSFWGALAADYGGGVSAAALEQAWKNGACCSSSSTPITPISSPDHNIYDPLSSEQPHARGTASANLLPTPASLPPPVRSDKTRISAILGIDASPRSPSERELVRQMELERGM